jgi:molybdate transport system ATP-binding protein
VTLDAVLDVELDDFALCDVSLRAADGETVAVVGPNGAGKTTALRALAGLLALDRGRITLDDEVLDDPAENQWVPPEARRVGYVFQDLLLFPHLSVLENVAFGLRARGRRARDARTIAQSWLEQLGLSGVAKSRPTALSGGEAQRVALARALVMEPRLLLLDEPLTALDVSTRPEVRRNLARHLSTFPGVALIVTHDPLEAMALADRLVVVEDGQVTQVGSPAEIRERPRTPYVADVAGVNLYRGTGSADGLVLADGGVLVSAEHLEGPALAVVHPRAVALHHRQPEGTPRNVWQGVVRHVDHEGDRARVHLDGPVPVTAEVTAAALGELGVTEGVSLWASVKATEVALYPA